jgi:DNA-binding transcriptional LysR family regulator
MERYRDMQLFAALAGQPSLASAARAARVSGPTLVRAIARLEARLGVALLQRSTRGVSLTTAGAAYLVDCVRLLAAVDAAEASAKGLQMQVQGSLRVCLPLLFSRYVMAPVLADYLANYPDMRLLVRYQDPHPNLHEEGLDVAILVGELPNSALIARPLGQVRPILCASPDYLAAHGDPNHPDELKQHRLIASPAPYDPFRTRASDLLHGARRDQCRRTGRWIVAVPQLSGA